VLTDPVMATVGKAFGKGIRLEGLFPFEDLIPEY